MSQETLFCFFTGTRQKDVQKDAERLALVRPGHPLVPIAGRGHHLGRKQNLFKFMLFQAMC
jgi:hypothetical protein